MKEDGQYSQGQLIDHLRMESSLWKARAENAEAQLEKALEQGKPYLKERYDSVCSANGRLHVENAELRAEVDSLKHFIQEREDCIIFPSMLTQLGLKTRAERKAQRGGE